MIRNNSVAIASPTTLLRYWHRKIFGPISAFLSSIWQQDRGWTLSVTPDSFSRIERLVYWILRGVNLRWWCCKMGIILIVMNTEIGKFILLIWEIMEVLARCNHALTMSSSILPTLLLIMLRPNNIQQVWETLAEPCNAITLLFKRELAWLGVYAYWILFNALRLLLGIRLITIFSFIVIVSKLFLHLPRINKLLELTTACKFWIVISNSFSLVAISSFI